MFLKKEFFKPEEIEILQFVFDNYPQEFQEERVKNNFCKTWKNKREPIRKILELYSVLPDFAKRVTEELKSAIQENN